MTRNVRTLCVIQVNSFFFGDKICHFLVLKCKFNYFSNYLEKKIPNFYVAKLGGEGIWFKDFWIKLFIFHSSFVEEVHFHFSQNLSPSTTSVLQLSPPHFDFTKVTNFFVGKPHFILSLHVIPSFMSKTISQIEKTHHQKNHNFTYNLKSAIIGLQNMQYVMKLHK